MPTSLLTTKFFIPPTRPELVPRLRLIDRLNSGLHGKLTIVSAPAGFGKTTLVTEWLQTIGNITPSIAIAWLSLDRDDNDPARFLAYIIAAHKQIEWIDATFGDGVSGMLQSPQPPTTETILTPLINEIAGLAGSVIPDKIILVLDDYHLIETQTIHDAVSFLLENLPSQMHLVIATREDPHLPISRLRARSQLTELRAADLRFSTAEAAEFLNQVMGLNLSNEDIQALEMRTEGWIAGLQLAAITLQGKANTSELIQSFTGSNRLVFDYLIEEVLEQQPEDIRSFLIQTAILERMNGSLCDAVTGQNNGQATLESLERANLFILPLDNERCWYRYHHLFADLLRQQFHKRTASYTGKDRIDVTKLHTLASIWYEENCFEIDAFHHAAAANDIERASQLIGGDRIPQHFLGTVKIILDWLDSLPKSVLDANPWLWWRYASLLLVNGQTTGVEEKLNAAESAIQGAELDDNDKNLIGQIAAARATLALTRYQLEAVLAQSRRALAHLHPDNLISRSNAHWTMGHAYLLQRDRGAAGRAFTQAITISQAVGNIFNTILATIGLGIVQESENQLHLAAETYNSVLQMSGDQPIQFVCEAHLGLARVFYEWNDLEAAEQQGKESLQLARQYDRVIDRYIRCEVFLARLKLTQGDVVGATAMLAQIAQSVHQYNFTQRIPEVAAAQVLALLRQGDQAGAIHLAKKHELLLSQARVCLAQGDATAALALLKRLRLEAESEGLEDERLKVMVLQAVAFHAQGEKETAVQVLNEALAMAESGGFIRTFVDEGPPMACLLSEALSYETDTAYVRRLLTAFLDTESIQPQESQLSVPESEWAEPLSDRELEVLHLIAAGLTNQEIADKLFISLHTAKVHAHNIYQKLGVKNRTQAIAKGRTLGILSQT